MKYIFVIFSLLIVSGCSTSKNTIDLKKSNKDSLLSKEFMLEPTYHIEIFKTEQKRKDDPIFKIAKERSLKPISSFYALKLSLKF